MKIEYLKLFTSNFEAQRQFYEEQLGLEVKILKNGVFRTALGFSVLEFQQQENAKPTHFALHIAARSERQALEWLQEKVDILETKDGEIMDFPAWNAKSIYFYDADNNIVEFIARENLYHPLKGEFSVESILGISEIGVAVSKVEEIFNFLNLSFGLTKFSGNYNTFCAVGDDAGLFIVIDKDKKTWIPADDEAFSANFEIKFTVKNAIFGASFKDERFTLL